MGLTDSPAMAARAERWVRHPVVGAVGLVLVYAVLSLLMDPRGYLGTDTGSKVATLEVMDQRGTAEVDVGYWAEDVDPDGSIHPIYQAERTEDGEWIAVTTLPMLEAARPLYALGGYRLALLLPILGSTLTAVAAGALARRLGHADGSGAFWLVGLASPLTIYALDLWEHSLGVACIVWSVVLLLDAVDAPGELPARAARAAGAGALLGLGATMRTETFVYALVAVGSAAAAAWRRSGALGRAIGLGAPAVVGFAVPWVLNGLLEAEVGGASRSARASGRVGSGGSDLSERLKETVLTLVGHNAGGYALSVLVGAAVAMVVVAAFRAEGRGDVRFARVAIALAACVYLIGSLDGLGFVPGLTAAFPVVLAVGWAARDAFPARYVLGVAIGSLPLVYAFQYVGGGSPQWGGRYTLGSAVLLGVVGLVGLVERFPSTGRGLVALSVVVTVLGVAWLGVRSRGVDHFFDDVKAEAQPVVIVRQAFLVREAGPALLGERWFSTKDEATFTEAVDAARELGETGFSVVEWGSEAPPAGALPDDVREVGRALLYFVDVPVGLVTYEFSGP